MCYTFPHDAIVFWNGELFNYLVYLVKKYSPEYAYPKSIAQLLLLSAIPCESLEYIYDLGEDIADRYITSNLSQDIISPEDAALSVLFKEELDEVLSTLTDREQVVLRLRFGLDDGCLRTLEEVGHMFKVSRERIRQIEAKAFRKLRHPNRSKRLRYYLD